MARTLARTQGQADLPTPKASRAGRRPLRDISANPPVHDIPYFADMQLDPARYPIEVGVPVGEPPFPVGRYGGVRAENGAEENTWDESDEEASTVSEISPIPPKRNRPPISAPSQTGFTGNDYKRAKLAGGRPALAKKVTAELDSDDELIVKMKQAKYQEKEIAQRLIDEGRTHYHAKTIGTRWARLKKVLQIRQDELLDADLTDWHEGDDEVLAKAIARADAEVAKMKKEADEKKWRIVADKMKLMTPVTNFSQNACRKRHQELEAGTAKPTPESIVNPDDEIKARIRSRREKERELEEVEDQGQGNRVYDENLGANGWTSRMREY